MAEGREPVFHGHRHGWVHGAIDQAVTFEAAQGLGQYLLGHSLHPAPEFGEPQYLLR